jgi:hypothetical protein
MANKNIPTNTGKHLERKKVHRGYEKKDLSKLKEVKCPWCSKVVKVHKGRLGSHVVQAGVKCVGIGHEVKGSLFERSGDESC